MVNPAVDAGDVDRSVTALVSSLLAAGVVFRLAQYLSRRSFWADEVELLYSIVGKTTRELFTGKLFGSQAAPPLFMAIQQGVARVFSLGELQQRGVPMVMNLLSLVLMLVLARRLLGRAGMVLALGAICLSDKLIDQASTLKPYSGDLAIALGLVLLALPAVERRDVKRFALIATLSAGLMWMSHAVILMFGAISLVMLIQLDWKDHRRLAVYALAHVLPAVSFLTFFALVMRQQQSDSFLRSFWLDAFPDWHHPLGIPRWLLLRSLDLINYPFAPLAWMEILLVPLIAVGVYAMWRPDRRAALLLLTMPVAVSIVAALAGKYPYAGRRVNLFMTPFLMILAGAGVDWLIAQRAGRFRAWGYGLVALMLGVAFVRDLPPLFHPRTNGHARPVVEYLRSHRTADQPMYAIRGGPDFDWYWQKDSAGPFADAAQAALPAGAFWLVYSGDPGRLKRDIAPVLQRFSEQATRSDSFLVNGAGAVLFIPK